MRKLIIFIGLIAISMLGFSQGQSDVDEIKVRDRFIFLNNDGLRAATGDSILAFINGRDTAYMIPYPSGGDTSFFDVTLTKIRPKAAIEVFIADTIAANTVNPDSVFHVNGGAVITGDVLIGGGWKNWTPVLTWDETPTAPTGVYRYKVENNTVSFEITMDGTNDSGSGITTLNITLPIVPKDINAYWPCSTLYNNNGKVMPNGRSVAVVDALDNTTRILYISQITIANLDDYIICVNGEYEITTK